MVAQAPCSPPIATTWSVVPAYAWSVGAGPPSPAIHAEAPRRVADRRDEQLMTAPRLARAPATGRSVTASPTWPTNHGLIPFVQSCLPSDARLDEPVERLVQLLVEGGLIGEAREVGQEPAEVLALVAGQVAPNLDEDEAVGGGPLRDGRSGRSADEGVQPGGRDGHDDQGGGDRDHPACRRPARRSERVRDDGRDPGARVRAGPGSVESLRSSLPPRSFTGARACSRRRACRRARTAAS